MNEELEKSLKQAEEIAKNGTGEEKKRFVEWAFASIEWNSLQASIGNKEALEVLNAVKKQYEAYLKALTSSRAKL